MAASAHPHPQSPSSWLTRFAPLLPAGAAVLEVTSGGGRHTRFLLGRGLRVTAVDRDVSGIADLAGRVEIVAADLEDGSPWPLAGRRFAGVVVTNYLHRPLFPALLSAIDDGGLLIYETFAHGNERFGRPRNPAHLLARNELLSLVDGLTLVAFEEGIVENRAVVQRLCAIRGDAPVPLP